MVQQMLWALATVAAEASVLCAAPEREERAAQAGAAMLTVS